MKRSIEQQIADLQRKQAQQQMHSELREGLDAYRKCLRTRSYTVLAHSLKTMSAIAEKLASMDDGNDA